MAPRLWAAKRIRLGSERRSSIQLTPAINQAPSEIGNQSRRRTVDTGARQR